MYLSYRTNKDALIFIESGKNKNSRRTNFRFYVLENDTLQATIYCLSDGIHGGGGIAVDVTSCTLYHAWEFADHDQNNLVQT